jgi:hypothetical protein
MTDQPIQGPHGARSTLGGNPFPPIADYVPQAFSHLALINAVIHLIREDERDSSAAPEE